MAINLDRLRGVADRARRVADPIRTTRVTIRVATWSGSQVGEGTRTIGDELALPDYVKVRELSSKEIASSGGKLEQGAVAVGPITPEFTGGGFTVDQLTPSATTDSGEVEYVLSGALNGVYRLFSVTAARPLRYMLTLNRTEKTP